MTSATAPRDIFLLIGQSNMAGRAAIEPADRIPIPGVWVQDRDGQWQPALDPLHWDQPDLAGVGLARTFAQVLLARRTHATIGLVPAAMGGSALGDWRPGAPLFREAVNRMRTALGDFGMLRGILWHQGETDSRDEALARDYGDRWAEMIVALRGELGVPGVPVIVGALGDFVGERDRGELPGYPFARLVNQQLALLPQRVVRAAFVPSQGLGHQGDRLHFDRGALIELGRRYAEAWLQLDQSWPTMRIEPQP